MCSCLLQTEVRYGPLFYRWFTMVLKWAYYQDSESGCILTADSWRPRQEFYGSSQEPRFVAVCLVRDPYRGPSVTDLYRGPLCRVLQSSDRSVAGGALSQDDPTLLQSRCFWPPDPETPCHTTWARLQIRVIQHVAHPRRHSTRCCASSLLMILASLADFSACASRLFSQS